MRLNRYLSRRVQTILMATRALIIGLLAAIFLIAPAPPADADQLKGEIKISKKDCRWLVRHQPAADVAYKPGINSRGHKVAPADLNPEQQLQLPTIIAIPLTVPVGDLLKKGTSTPVDGSDVGVGLVTINRKSGEVQYEGKTIVTGERDRMVVACRKLLRRRR